MKVPNYLSRLASSPRIKHSASLRHYVEECRQPALLKALVPDFAIQTKGELSKMKALKTLVLLLLTVIIFPAAVFAGYGVNGSNSYLAGLGTPDDYVLVQHDPELSQGADASIEAWIYITDMTSLNYIIVKGSQMGTSAYAFYINTDGRPAIRFGNLNLVSNGAVVPMNTWTHVAVTWNDPGDISVNFYIDGSLVGTTITTPGTVLTNSHDVRIGSAEFGSEGFGGYIDEVRMWGGVLTEQQIRQNRFVGLGEKPASNFEGTNFSGSYHYDELVASWTFNIGAGAFTWEYIGGHYGVRQGNAAINNAVFGYPMPYNNVLFFPNSAGSDSYVLLKDSSAFTNSLLIDGTMDFWFRLDAVNPATEGAIISKGSTSETNSFYLGISGGNTGKLVFRIGSNTVQSGGPSIPRYGWNHIAVTWQDLGPGFAVKFYINGEQNDSLYLNRNTMPENTEPIRIGSSDAFPTSSVLKSAYIDELRFWDEVIPDNYLQKMMFASTDALKEYFEDELVVSWGFDGNMIPDGRFNRMRGTFDNGLTNYCRFSSYYNEQNFTGNVLDGDYLPHITVMKSNDPESHTFPLGYYMAVPFDTIPENNANGLTSVINVGPSFPDNNVNNVELFLSAAAPVLGDYIITLTAPNGSSRIVMNNNGGDKHNILTNFSDDALMGLNSPEMIAPYTNEVRPFQAFGNFDNSPARGNWIINIQQMASDNPMGFSPAILNGWGIRLNDQDVTGIQSVTSEIPGKYELSQNYPNPFNPSTSIKFSIPQSGVTILKIYDILGKEIASLVNEKLNSGTYEYKFNAAGLTSGVYFYKLQSGTFSEVRKMLLIK